MENTKGKLTLDALPYDCLECIFGKVADLRTQIRLSVVCKVFQEVLVRMWRRNEDYHFIDLPLYGIDMRRKYFTYFMLTIHTAIQKIRILDDVVTFYCAIKPSKIKCFPNVLDLCIWTYQKFQYSLLSPMFPNLRSLNVLVEYEHCVLHAISFKQLRELSLTFRDINHRQLQELFECMPKVKINLDLRKINCFEFLVNSSFEKWQQLQVLKLNSNDLGHAVNKVLKLPNLKNITVKLDSYNAEDINNFYKILENKSSKITGFAIDNEYMKLKLHWDTNFQKFKCNKLKKFAIMSCKDDMLEEVFGIKGLTYLIFRFDFLPKKALKILESCLKLEVLVINPLIDQKIIEEFLNAAMNVLRCRKERKSLLNVYVHTKNVCNIKKHPSYADWTSVMNILNKMPRETDYVEYYTIKFEGGYSIDFD